MIAEPSSVWQEKPFNRALFESNLQIGDEVVPKPEVCDEFNVLCNYPLNPNAAGVRYLELVKREWNTTSGNGNVDFLDLGRLSSSVMLFKGEYEVKIFNQALV